MHGSERFWFLDSAERVHPKLWFVVVKMVMLEKFPSRKRKRKSSGRSLANGLGRPKSAKLFPAFAFFLSLFLQLELEPSSLSSSRSPQQHQTWWKRFCFLSGQSSPMNDQGLPTMLAASVIIGLLSSLGHSLKRPEQVVLLISTRRIAIIVWHLSHYYSGRG